MFESIQFSGFVGLLLAVQQQPVVVSLEASGKRFQEYTGDPEVFSEDPNSPCFSGGVDHNVLLVGYEFEGEGAPYWIIRNSWGSSWGINGYMKLAMTGGFGTCGINILPGYYPVVKEESDPCNDVSYGSINWPNDMAGRVTPCGKSSCLVANGTTSNSNSNVCQCSPDVFVTSDNPDKSQICVLANPCPYYPINPCGVGTCVPGTAGSYGCVCPFGYIQGNNDQGAGVTCVPGVLSSGSLTYTVPSNTNFSCDLIAQSYGISPNRLEAINSNLRLNCSQAIPGGTTISILTNYSGCSLPYTLDDNDSCGTVAELFGLPALAGPGSPNPYLNCSRLYPGQQVCIIQGTPPPVPLCTQPYTLKGGESCFSIIDEYFDGNATEFFSLNLGLYCDRVVEGSTGLSVSQVCLGATSMEAYYKKCLYGQGIKMQPWDNCKTILNKYFKGKHSNFVKANKRKCVRKSVVDIICTKWK